MSIENMTDLARTMVEDLDPDVTQEKLEEALALVANERKLKKLDAQEVVDKLHEMPEQLVEAISSHLDPLQRMSTLFDHLYDLSKPQTQKMFESFKSDLERVKRDAADVLFPRGDFHKDGIVYSVYVDLFNQNFKGLEDKLDHLQDIGVTIVWLLPILDSPMFDAGFDISDYHKIRPDLGTTSDFHHFIKEAHKRDIKVIFDVALNHTSKDHPWFLDAKTGPNSKHRDYYIWSKDTNLYKEARIIFKGLCKSNWEQCGEEYYLHRFFPEQPDLNYKNPKVLLAVSRIMIFWILHGIDGFRGDAVPFLWKDEGTNCENLSKTHTIVKFFRAILDYLAPGAVLLAEACQPPMEVVAYFGAEGDECQVAYHFPLMPRMFLSMSTQDRRHIIQTLDTKVTPSILDTCQWFVFLRVHDELTLEMVTEEERSLIHGYYCRDNRWNFRDGEGVAARLADLLQYDPNRISLAYSIMLTLIGTPIIFYGDEFGKTQDIDYYNDMYKQTNIPDARYYVRGRIDWEKTNADLRDPATFTYQVHHIVKSHVLARKKHKAFSRGTFEFLDLKDKTGQVNNKLLAYVRQYKTETIVVLNNLGEDEIISEFPYLDRVQMPEALNTHTARQYSDLLGQMVHFDKGTESLEGKNTIRVGPFGHYWIKLN